MSRPGLHWPNRNDDDGAARARFLAGRFSSAVVMTVTPPSVASWVRSQVDLVVARVYEPSGDLAAPADVAQRHEQWIRSAGDVWVQILNEPDLEYSQLSPEAFAVWWLACAAALRASVPGVRVGFPAPSIAGSDEYWTRVISTGVLVHADFIGERAYWQRDVDAESPLFGRRWERSSACGRPIFLTEFGCTWCQTPKPQKALEYLDYCRGLPRCVVPVGAFIGAGGDPRWDSVEAGCLWIDDAMAGQIGGGEGVFVVDPNVVARVLLYRTEIVAAAQLEGLPPSVVAGLILVESGGNARAIGPDNGGSLGHAVGLMQVLQSHFAATDSPFDVVTNLRVGCQILAAGQKRYGGRLVSGLAAYFGAVDEQGNPTSGHDVTGATGLTYVADVEAAAQSFLELDRGLGPVPSPTPIWSGQPLADVEFQAYAPNTKTWREACTNLKGIADDALTCGRKIVGDVAASWGTR